MSMDPNKWINTLPNINKESDLENFMQGQKDKAINVFNENTKKFPYYVLSYFNLARIYSEKDESKKTIALFNKSIEIDPRFIDSYIYLADYYISRNLFDDAKKVSKKCIDSKP